MEVKFSSEVADVLRASGWDPQRAVDITQWTVPFEERGIRAHQEAEGFLAQFGGLGARDLALTAPESRLSWTLFSAWERRTASPSGAKSWGFICSRSGSWTKGASS
jgi:hypothetical protein